MPNHTWGLIAQDWSIARGTWFTGDPANSTCEAALTESCRRLKAAGRVTRCFIYHNSELALQWMESQRAIMSDPSKEHLFLHYLPGNPSGEPPGKVYNDTISWGAQWFFNHTLPEARALFISSLLAVLNASSDVDGSFTDDVDGLPAEHPTVPTELGMSAAELAELRYATQSMGNDLISTLTLANKYTWQAFGSRDTSSPHAVARGYVGVTPTTCASFMRTFCAPEYQKRPMLMHMDVSSPANANATLAAFLITRPPYAYVGFAWESNDSKFTPLFYLDVGEPAGGALCSEGPPGVFSRLYTLGTPVLNCMSFEAQLPFKELP